MSNKWEYIGDVNLEYGGVFFNMESAEHGYIEAVEIVDLESATGADGLLLIQELTVFGFDDKAKVKSALESMGMSTQDLRGKGKESVLLELAIALQSYGYYDVIPSDPYGPNNFVIVTQDYFGNKDSWDNWNPDKEKSVKLAKKYNHNLSEFVDGEFLF